MQTVTRGQGGRGVAGNWRIRHKLLLGLALVMGVMGLLLAGTLKGLASYRATMRTIENKLDELAEANRLRDAIKVLKKGSERSQQPPSPNSVKRLLLQKPPSGLSK